MMKKGYIATARMMNFQEKKRKKVFCNFTDETSFLMKNREKEEFTSILIIVGVALILFIMGFLLLFSFNPIIMIAGTIIIYISFCIMLWCFFYDQSLDDSYDFQEQLFRIFRIRQEQLLLSKKLII